MPSPRELSLFSRAQVQETFTIAQRTLRYPGLIFLCAPHKKEYGRLLVVTPATSGIAPKRNKIRRQLKAIFYEQQLFTLGYDVIVLVRKEAMAHTFDELARLLKQALQNARALIPLGPKKPETINPDSPKPGKAS